MKKSGKCWAARASWQPLPGPPGILDKNDIKYVGGGNNLSFASKSFVREINGKKIGFYACAEHEFSISTDKTCGANPFDPLESFDHVVKLKKECDYVIVLYHGGKEHYRYPSPNLQKICRKFIEKGANLVICQHSHCIGCKEDYQDGTIVYGQGNFIFDRNNKGEYWDTSLLIKLNDDFSIEYIPLVKVDGGVRLAEGENAQEIINNFDKRSKEITIDGFIEKKYSEFANKMIEGYLFSFCGMKRTFMFRVINKLTGYRYSKWLLKKKINNLEIEETLSISPRKTLHIIRAFGERFLIASDATSTTLLAKLNSDGTITEEIPSESNVDFKEIMQSEEAEIAKAKLQQSNSVIQSMLKKLNN